MIALSAGAAARGLPVYLPYLEADADADTLVCEMTGGASTNETAVGGGLSGSDLVFTQSGGIAAASGGYRALSAGQYFTCAQAVLDLLSGDEWSLLWHIDNLPVATSSRYLAYCSGDTLIDLYHSNDSGLSNRVIPQTGGSGVYASNWPTIIADPPTGPGWMSMWRKAGINHFAYGDGDPDDPPTGWDWFPENSRQVNIGNGDFSSVPNWTQRHIIGHSGAFSIGRLIVSKIGLQACPL